MGSQQLTLLFPTSCLKFPGISGSGLRGIVCWDLGLLSKGEGGGGASKLTEAGRVLGAVCVLSCLQRLEVELHPWHAVGQWGYWPALPFALCLCMLLSLYGLRDILWSVTLPCKPELPPGMQRLVAIGMAARMPSLSDDGCCCLRASVGAG